MRQQIVIVDYGMGNIHSVVRKLRLLGIEPSISQSVHDILHADKIILPGVGHFGKAMQSLEQSGKAQALHEAVLHLKKPILGICLGMQLMNESSEEAPGVQGLKWFDGHLKHFSIANTLKYKVPHMGWNTVQPLQENILLQGIAPDDEFYFLHSYHLSSLSPQHALQQATYEYSFVASVARDHIFGVQYHPEKSLAAGMQLFKNFIAL